MGTFFAGLRGEWHGCAFGQIFRGAEFYWFPCSWDRIILPTGGDAVLAWPIPAIMFRSYIFIRTHVFSTVLHVITCLETKAAGNDGQPTRAVPARVARALVGLGFACSRCVYPLLAPDGVVRDYECTGHLSRMQQLVQALSVARRHAS